jgi:hypothetical protein
MQTNLLGIITVDFNIIDQPLITYLAFVRYWRENGSIMEWHMLFIDFMKTYDSFRSKVLVSYSILIEFGIPMKIVRLIKMCLNETYKKFCIGKNLSDAFPIQNGLKQGDTLSPLLFNFALGYAIRKIKENQKELKLNENISYWSMLMMLIHCIKA